MDDLGNSGGITTSEILRFFFAIPPLRIQNDLANLGSDSNQHRRGEQELRDSGCDTSEKLAESFHRRLLLGVNMMRVSELPLDLILFAATVTAHEIAELSCSDSCGRGRLSELCQIRDSLDGSGTGHEAPDDVLLADALVDSIHDSVFLEILKRYEMEHISRLFENDRPLYEIRCVVGRQLIVGERDGPKEHSETVANFRKLYGPEYVQEYLRRLKIHDLLPD